METALYMAELDLESTHEDCRDLHEVIQLIAVCKRAEVHPSHYPNSFF